MASMVILLVYIAIIYGVLRLVEYGLVRGWRHWRQRRQRRGDQVIIITAGPDEGPRPPRPKLKREIRGQDGIGSGEAPVTEPG